MEKKINGDSKSSRLNFVTFCFIVLVIGIFSVVINLPVALAASPVKVGLLLPYSKVYAVLGESITNGMELVFEREGWKVAGREIKVIKEDTEVNPEVGLLKARKLIGKDRVDFVSGPVSSAVALSIRDIFHNSKKILLISNAGVNALTREKCSPYVFRTSFSAWMGGWAPSRWIYKNISDSIYTIAPDYAAGYSTMAGFKEGYLSVGGKIIAEGYAPLGTSDYGPYLTKIKQANPKAIFAFFAGRDAINFVKQFKEFGLKEKVRITGAGWLFAEDVLPVQGRAALGAIHAHHYSMNLDIPENKDFVRLYEKKFGKKPDAYSVQGWDTAEVIVRALKATNGDTSDVRKLIKVIKDIQFKSPRGLFRFDPLTHNAIIDWYILEVREKDGKVYNWPIDKIPSVRDPGHCPQPGM